MALSDLRKQIDEVDDEILRLFLERQDLSMQVAEYKNAHNIPIVNKQREREILADETAKSGENERYAYHLFSTLFELSRSRQAELTNAPTRVVEQVSKALKRSSDLFPQTGRIAVQGTEGANSQVACDHLFPRGTIVYCESFDDVVASVETGACEFGVLPIENSSNGSVREVYNLLRDHRLNIVRSTRQCIRHELLALPGATLDDITEIYSHEQALGQCRKYLSSLKGVKITSCANTAVAAQMVSESGNIHASPISAHPCRAL